MLTQIIIIIILYYARGPTEFFFYNGTYNKITLLAQQKIVDKDRFF